MADPLPNLLSIITTIATVAGLLLGVYVFIRNRQDARDKQAAELHVRYDSIDGDSAMRVIGAFRDERLSSGESYYATFKRERPVHIEEARAKLRSFWDWVITQYESDAIPKDVLASTNAWLARGNNYRLLVEPIDIANWYSLKGANFYGTSGKHYLRLTPDKDVVRPRRFYVLEEVYRNAYPDRKESSIDNALEELKAAGIAQAQQLSDRLRRSAHQYSNEIVLK